MVYSEIHQMDVINYYQKISKTKTYCLIAILLTLEFIIFDSYGSHRFTSIHPRWNDQIQYLTEAYTGYISIHADGFLDAIYHSITNPSSQGVLLRTISVLLFSVVEPSRSAALSLNILGLIAWQLTLFIAISRLTKSPIAWAAFVLPLLMDGSWIDQPGSAYDFRLDHIAMCAVGVTLSFVLISEGFRSFKWSCLVGLSIALTVLLRFITSTYFFLILLFVIIWFIFAEDKKIRFRNLLSSLGLVILLVAPVFYIHRLEIWNYYYVGHYTGPESFIRNQNYSFIKSFYIIVKLLQYDHIGNFFWIIFLFGILAYINLCKSIIHLKNVDFIFIYFGLLFVLAPAIILALHPQLSSVVLSAICPGVVILVIGIWDILYPKDGFTTRHIYVSGLIFILGFTFYFQRQTRALIPESTNLEFLKVKNVTSLITTKSNIARIERPRIAVNFISDAFDAQIMRVMVYEKYHRWVQFEMTLPTGIAEPTDQQVLDQLKVSDFIYYTDTEIINGYPYDKKLYKMRNIVKAWCDKNMRVIKDFNYFEKHIILFQKK